MFKQYLIKQNQTIFPNYLNSTAKNAVLASFYHPTISVLLYILLGLNFSSTSTDNPYQSYSIGLWNTSDATQLQSFDVPQFNCSLGCEMKVTSSLLLIQSALEVGWYKKGNVLIDTSNEYYSAKTSVSGPKNYSFNRVADIFDNILIMMKNNDLYVEASRVNAPGFDQFSYLTLSPYLNDTTFAVKSVSINQYATNIIYVHGGIKVNGFYINCSYCLTNASFVANQSLSSMGSTIYIKDSSSAHIRILSAYSQSQPINWLIFDNQAYTCDYQYSMFLNSSNMYHFYTGTQVFRNTVMNNNEVVLYRSDYNFFMRAPIPSQNNFRAAYQQSASYTIALANDSSKIAISSGVGSMAEYFSVDDCSLYTKSANQSYFCSCDHYSEIGSCLTLAEYALSNPTDSTPLPTYIIIIIAVVAVVFGITVAVVSVIIYKKCIKKQHPPRIPWKYNPVQMMSFQI